MTIRIIVIALEGDMKIFNFFRKREIEDSLFGKLRFNGANTWFGVCYFSPIEKEVRISLEGAERGIFNDAHQTFSDLVYRFESLKPLIFSELLRLCNEHIPNNEIEDSNKLVSLCRRILV